MVIARQAIKATYNLFEEIGLQKQLREVGNDENRLDEMAQYAADNEGLDQAYVAT
ncbi:MAG: hypothetical protein ACOYJF_02460 [Prevotella sp.]|jgi:alcohol dehydrogenase class IV